MARYIIPLIIIIALLIYFFYPGGVDTSEIESVLNGMKDSAEHNDPGEITEQFSINYRDEYGATYPVVKKIIKEAFERYDGIEPSYSGLSVSVSENEEGDMEAAANMDVSVRGIKSGAPRYLIGTADSPDNITVTLKKSPLGGWKIMKVEGIDKADGLY